MPRTNAPAAPQTKSRKRGRLPSRLLLCGTAAMILLAQATPGSGQSDQDTSGSIAMTMKDDLAHREKDIHWPQGFDPAEAELINADGFRVRLPVRGRKEPVVLDSRKLPGKVTAGGASGVKIVAVATNLANTSPPG